MNVKTSGRSVLNTIRFLGSLISQSQRLKQSSSPGGHHSDTGMEEHQTLIKAELLTSEETNSKGKTFSSKFHL